MVSNIIPFMTEHIVNNTFFYIPYYQMDNSKLNNEIKNTIKYIKIFGERNSGTNFITNLLKKNTKDVEIINGYYQSEYGWKHGKPKINSTNIDIIKDTLFICVIRDLEPWLRSMYKSPYHIHKGNMNFLKFITTNIQSSEGRQDHDVFTNKEETGKNIFDLRYYKISCYLDLYSKVDNIIIVNLENLQKYKGKNLIDFISKFISVKSFFIPIYHHTKTGRENSLNRDIYLNYDEIRYKKIISNHTKIEFENFVNELKSDFKYKISSI